MTDLIKSLRSLCGDDWPNLRSDVRLAIRTESGSEWHFAERRYRRTAVDQVDTGSIDNALDYGVWHRYRDIIVETYDDHCRLRIRPASRPRTSSGIETGPITAVAID